MIQKQDHKGQSKHMYIDGEIRWREQNKIIQKYSYSVVTLF